jgi:putative endonuclease
MYILSCADESYYTCSTNNLPLRIQQHLNGDGAKHTTKRLPLELVYYEEFDWIDQVFYREKQVQGWSRVKKEALIQSRPADLHLLAECKNETYYKNKK